MILVYIRQSDQQRTMILVRIRPSYQHRTTILVCAGHRIARCLYLCMYMYMYMRTPSRPVRTTRLRIAVPITPITVTTDRDGGNDLANERPATHDPSHEPLTLRARRGRQKMHG